MRGVGFIEKRVVSHAWTEESADRRELVVPSQEQRISLNHKEPYRAPLQSEMHR
jgi:hypothetical protein